MNEKDCVKILFEERIPITPEIYYMLQYSDRFREDIRGLSVNFEVTSDKQFITLSSEKRILLTVVKREYFNPDTNTFISIKVDDEEMKALFDGNPNGEYNNFNENMTLILSRLSKNRLCEFIPKDRIKDNIFKRQNVLIVFVEKSREQKLRHKIEDFFRSETIKTKLKTRRDMDENIVLKEYVYTGKKLAGCKRTRWTIDLIQSIQSKIPPPDFEGLGKGLIFNYNDGCIPFVTVCASTRKDKTQLPFTLNIPMIYLVNNKEMTRNKTENDTYSRFIDISKCFFKCVENDVETMKGNHERIDECELFLPFFIYTLLRETKKARISDDEHWLESQVNIGNEPKFCKMSIEEARARIKDLFKDGLKPIIFLDELHAQDSADLHTEYIYTRNLIRKLDLISFFMRTDYKNSGCSVRPDNLSKGTRYKKCNGSGCWCLNFPIVEVFFSRIDNKKEI